MFRLFSIHPKLNWRSCKQRENPDVLSVCLTDQFSFLLINFNYQMNKTMMRPILCAACAILWANAACAQSSVTLYGVVAEGVDVTTNTNTSAAGAPPKGSTVVQLRSGILSAARWGVTGAEDLGGGTRAVFKLESGFNVSNGAMAVSGDLFNRQAYVGLENNDYGSVRFGRQFDLVEDFIGNYVANVAWGGATFVHPLDNDNSNGSFQLSNAIEYRSPSFMNTRMALLYAMSNSTGFATNRATGAALEYGNKPLSLTAVYEVVDNPGSSANAGGADPSNMALWSAAKQSIFGAAARYDLNKYTMNLVYTHTDITNATANTYLSTPLNGHTSLAFNNVELNASHYFTPSFLVGGMYSLTWARITDGGSSTKVWNQAGLLADYFLSKRTDVYLLGAYQHVSGSPIGVPGLDNGYLVVSSGPSSNSSQAVFRLGLRTTF
jgi:predicted porin